MISRKYVNYVTIKEITMGDALNTPLDEVSAFLEGYEKGMHNSIVALSRILQAKSKCATITKKEIGEFLSLSEKEVKNFVSDLPSIIRGRYLTLLVAEKMLESASLVSENMIKKRKGKL